MPYSEFSGIDVGREVSVGVYGVDSGQIIRLWNAGAERILGYVGREAMGRPCHQVLCASPSEGLPPVCQRGCPFMRLAGQGRIPPPLRTRLLAASGQRIRVTLAPLIAPTAEGRMVLLHVFHELPEAELGDAAGDGRLFDITPDGVAAAAPAGAAALTGRELEALRLMAAGMTNGEIAENLILSYHTVRNHVSSIRNKLQARNRQQAAIIAGDLGLI